MIGLFGGTFDPVHFGHLRIALDVLEQQRLTEIRFIPLHHPVHRGQPDATPMQRLEMLQLAIADTPKFSLDDRELLSNQPSYTLHTLQSLRQEYPDKQFCLMVGGDAFNQFLSWHQPMEILHLCHIIVMNRPGSAINKDLDTLLTHHLLDKNARLKDYPVGKIVFQAVTQLDISSSDIRQRIQQGNRSQFLLPENVRQYITDHCLYLKGLARQ